MYCKDLCGVGMSMIRWHAMGTSPTANLTSKASDRSSDRHYEKHLVEL